MTFYCLLKTAAKPTVVVVFAYNSSNFDCNHLKILKAVYAGQK